jgi:hypothetical protein
MSADAVGGCPMSAPTTTPREPAASVFNGPAVLLTALLLVIASYFLASLLTSHVTHALPGITRDVVGLLHLKPVPARPPRRGIQVAAP